MEDDSSLLPWRRAREDIQVAARGKVRRIRSCRKPGLCSFLEAGGYLRKIGDYSFESHSNHTANSNHIANSTHAEMPAANCRYRRHRNRFVVAQYLRAGY